MKNNHKSISQFPKNKSEVESIIKLINDVALSFYLRLARLINDHTIGISIEMQE